ncbi:hypothetical protein OIB37_29390 [Streptomyces sp. NBC_00820]|uniref:hypothetical protein n=1 Tax=Streptomyces sp. NBC_00820 TaxID=2975842 RepID=UPI002ED03E17|nr:hypothetical protein OIB37_29390 [Streptomyces sp. NBC_00820]
MRIHAVLGIAMAMCACALLQGCSSNDCTGGSVCGAHNAVDQPPASDAARRPAAGAGADDALLLTTKWPTIKSCDGTTSVAMSTGGKPLTAFFTDQQDFRSRVAAPNSKGGVWGSGHLYLDLSTGSAETTVTVDEVHLTARLPKKIAPPSWVALTQGGCGGVKERVFELDLDRPRLVDKGVVDDGYTDPTDPPVRTNPLGSGFTVSASDPAIIRVDAQACRGNYEWSLQIDYSYRGKSLHKVVGPFRSFGAASPSTDVYTPSPSTGKTGAPSSSANVRPIGCPATP